MDSIQCRHNDGVIRVAVTMILLSCNTKLVYTDSDPLLLSLSAYSLPCSMLAFGCMHSKLVLTFNAAFVLL